MSNFGEVIRQLEDFVLAENDLYGAGRVPFEHEGETQYGYPYVRSSHRLFEEAALVCSNLIPKPVHDIRFLEVGCGLGTKCEIARQHGMHATGFDLKSEYVTLARQIFLDCTFLEANALEFDYGEFDLVYYHVPFFDDRLLFQLELRIFSHLPIGGVLLVTNFSQAFQRAMYDSDGIRTSFRSVFFDPGLELGDLQVLQKKSIFDVQSLAGLS
ncbi:MAG: methyltransferase domain-containing protein [Planctomycetota bacterium]|nr:methyltransferase domain-containing protein [Planctomycetota bacterium]MDA1178978.1 methyltransferase domain-containing protein [Planctomycetota bacterium]